MAKNLKQMAEELVNRLRPVAQTYSNVYQKVSPFVPFAPKLTIPKQVKQNYQNVRNFANNAENFVKNRIVAPVHKTITQNTFTRTPLGSLTPFTAPATHLMTANGIKTPTVGDALGFLNPLKVYDQKTKRLFPNSPIYDLPDQKKMIEMAKNRGVKGINKAWEPIMDKTAIAGLLAGPKAKNFKPQFSSLADKKPRMEISDRQSYLKPTKLQAKVKEGATRLGDIFEHPGLYKQYPNLKQLRVVFDSSMQKGENGSFNPKTFTLTLNPRLSQGEMRSTILHEVQHGIQNIEGFARGGSPTVMAKDVFPTLREIKAERDNLRATIEELSKPFQRGERSYEETMKTIKPLMEKADLLEQEYQNLAAYGQYYDKYKRLSGEIEARDVQAREALSPQQRRYTQPYASQNIPLKDQIVRFRDGESASIKIKPQKIDKRLPGTMYTVSKKQAEYTPNMKKTLKEDDFIAGLEADQKKIFDQTGQVPPPGGKGGNKGPKQNTMSGGYFTPESTEQSKVRIDPEYEKGGVINWLKKKFYPSSTQPKDVVEATRTWDIGRKTARVDANQVNLNFQTKAKALGIDPDMEWKIAMYSEITDPKEAASVAKELGLNKDILDVAKPLIEEHKAFNKQIRDEAIKNGIDLGYIENHLMHIYEDAPAQVEAVLSKLKGRGLGEKPGFSKTRTTPVYFYTQGQLTPKYTSLGQINAYMYEQLQKALANKKFSVYLKNSGRILPSSEAPQGWRPIISDYFPRSSTGETYYAPKDLADYMNNVFGGGDNNQLLEKVGNLSTWLQDKKLTGGIKTVNGFTVSQWIKDMTMAIGDITTLNIRRGLGTAKASTMAFIRDWIPGMTKDFELRNQDVIKEMAGQGLGNTGSFDYTTTGKNVASKIKISNVGERLNRNWDRISNNPTFKRFMFQRQVDLYKNIKASLMRDGISEDQAIKIAADNLKNYDGITRELGRSADLQNGLNTFFMAPKYRESTIGSLVNTAKGAFKISDPQYELSRRLGIGMFVTFMIYNGINRRLNDGKNMWENPAGREGELVIPKNKIFKDADPNEYYSIPWMPGYTAAPRRIVSGTFSLAKGDTQEAIKQYSGLGSVGLQTTGELISGKDYFGRDIYTDGKPNLKEAAIYAASSNAPGYVREPVAYSQAYKRYEDKIAQGKKASPPSKAVAVARTLELPLKEGKFTVQFYEYEKRNTKGLTEQQRQLYETIYNSDESKLGEGEKMRKDMMDAQNLLANPEILQAREKIERETAQYLKRPINPFFDLTPEQQRIVLQIKTLAPGDSTKSQLQSANIDWLKPYWTANSAFYDELEKQGVIANKDSDTTSYFQTSPEMRKKLDYYYSLPYGTGARSQFIRENPDLVDYWNEKREFTNKQRALLGLPPLEDTFSGWGNYKKKPKKITIKKVKAPKIKFSMGKSKKLKAYKPGKLNFKIKSKKPKNILTSVKISNKI